jgi:hypothetical protein
MEEQVDETSKRTENLYGCHIEIINDRVLKEYKDGVAFNDMTLVYNFIKIL